MGGTLTFVRFFRDRRSFALPVVIAILLHSPRADAGEIEPRNYLNVPVGVNFLLAGYMYSDGGLSTPASSPIQDAHLVIHTGLAAYAHAFDIWGNSGKVDVVVPYSSLSGNAMVDGEQRDRKVTGFIDPRVRFGVNFIGAPALALKEFADYRQDLIVGASIQVSAPLGQYDPDRLVNLGNNRWSFKPDIGISKAWGDFTLELSGGMIIFTTNDDYFGGNTLEQEPVYTGQAHVTYSLGKGAWAAVSGTYDHGGRTSTNGVDNDDFAKNSRWQATLAIPLNRNNSIKLFGGTGVSVRTGSDYDLVAVIWQYRWGAGL
jgi:hypothetical protein